jgi:hypothetical protein
MKKIYLSLTLFSFGAIAIGQSVLPVSKQKAYAELATKMPKPLNSHAIQPKSGDTVWINQFENATEWTFDGPNTANPTNNGWSIGNDVSISWAFGQAGNMGTTGDFARFVNNDPTAGTEVQAGPWTLTYNGTIDLTGVPAPHLEFNQFGAKFADMQAVELSFDGGTTWVRVADNEDEELLTAGGGSVYDRPAFKRYNITTYVADAVANADPINAVQIRLFWDGGDNGGTMTYITYGWFVDDIRIVEGYNNDLTILSDDIFAGTLGIPYYYMPALQQTDMSFLGAIKNNGAQDQNGVQLEVEVLQGATNVATVASPGITLPVTALDTLQTSNFLPAGSPGDTYSLVYRAIQDENEDFPSDNVRNAVFNITDTVFGVDNNNRSGGFTNFASQSGQAVQIGNQMEVFANTKISSVSIYVNDDADAIGQSIYGEVQILNAAGDAFDFLVLTDEYDITANDIGGWVTLPLQSIEDVTAGANLLVLAGHFGAGGTINDVSFGMAQRVADGVVLGADANGGLIQLLDPRAIMVRLNMNPLASIDEEALVASNMNLYPNPAADYTTLEFELLNDTKMSFEISDVTGKVVYSEALSNLSKGKHSINIDTQTFSEGVYFLNVRTGNNVTSKKLVIK